MREVSVLVVIKRLSVLSNGNLPKGATCNDGIFCNGEDRCDGNGTCFHSVSIRIFFVENHCCISEPTQHKFSP
jgi:hypothetical protein